MRSIASTPAEYLASLPADRQRAVRGIRRELRRNLPAGFVERMAYGMLAYVVPLKRYPAGYHCAPGQPLPFINLASQKQHISLYHLGLYDGALRTWLENAWARQSDARLELATCCLRFRDPAAIPLELIGRLARRITVKAWIATYEASIRRR